jgi:hypothetical protein
MDPRACSLPYSAASCFVSGDADKIEFHRDDRIRHLTRRLVRESVAVKNWATPIRRIPEPRLREDRDPAESHHAGRGDHRDSVLFSVLIRQR